MVNAQRSPQMFPKPPRRMRQPRKDAIRWRAELAEARAAYAEADRDELLARTNAALREADRRTAFLLAAVLVLIALVLVAGRIGGLIP